MEEMQVEKQRMEEMKTEEEKIDKGQIREPKGKKGKFLSWHNWIACGLAVSFLLSLFCIACYGIFRRNASENDFYDNPLEQQENVEWLMEQSFVLYHDLMQKQSSETLSYLELYVTPAEGCEWVLDEECAGAYFAGALDEAEPVSEGDVPSDAGRVYSYLNYLKNEYFSTLESQFSDVIYTFDYVCEDLKTGESVTNALTAESIADQDPYFILSFVFDEYGNCEVEMADCGGRDTQLRKLAGQAARTVSLQSDINYSRFNEEASVGLDAYLTLGKPRNCRVTYCIEQDDWNRFEQGNWLLLRGTTYGLRSRSFARYSDSGLGGMLAVLWFATGGLALCWPFFSGKKTKMPVGPATRWLRLPLEALLVGGYIGFGVGISLCLDLAVHTLSGSAVQALHFPTVGGLDLEAPAVYFCNLLLQAAFFFLAWLIGMNLGDMRRIGVWGYIRARSLIYRFFPFIKGRVVRFYDTLSHFDLTRRANRLIIKLVLINGVILFTISSLWFGGFGIAVVYSILLYFILRKYVSDLQKKYGLLLKSTNEIAEGNLNVQIKEDLGVFEPFKPQIQRIQDGFRRAVEEEVKSQRMKSELITNVSHDLKTPLTAIITYINLLKEPKITEEQRKEYLDTLERKSLRLKVLIEDLFEVSKASSQSMTLNIMDVDVMNLVKQAAFEMGDKLAERNLELRMALPEEKVILRLDSQRTYRIYENLFGNIAKYAMPGTRVYVNGFRVEDKVVIALKNITEEEISVKPEELMERFVRGDASRNTEGSGLGLAIAKSFTEMQGGTLELEVDGDLFKVVTIWQG